MPGFRDGNTPVAILANKYDRIGTSNTTSTANATSGACLTVENVCVALGVDTLQVP